MENFDNRSILVDSGSIALWVYEQGKEDPQSPNPKIHPDGYPYRIHIFSYKINKIIFVRLSKVKRK